MPSPPGSDPGWCHSFEMPHIAVGLNAAGEPEGLTLCAPLQDADILSSDGQAFQEAIDVLLQKFDALSQVMHRQARLILMEPDSPLCETLFEFTSHLSLHPRR